MGRRVVEEAVLGQVVGKEGGRRRKPSRGEVGKDLLCLCLQINTLSLFLPSE